MKTYNYERVGLMLDYINSSKEKIEPLELIGKFIPSLYELNLVYNKTLKGKYYNVRIDMQSIELKGALKKAYQLKKELDFGEKMIINYLQKDNKETEELNMKSGQKVYNSELGNGVIVQVFTDDLMTIKFDTKQYPCMCSQKGYTVYDDRKRKLELR